MRYTGPKAKRARRQGMNLYSADKYDKILQRKPTAPGKDPKAKAGRGKLSEYGQQLLEKQKVCWIYGLTDKQLQRVFSEASRKVGNTDVQIKALLERRLDNALFRAGFARTRMQARQFISHGLFMVNDQRVTIPSYLLARGQKIKVRPQAKTSPVFEGVLAAHERYTPPDWLKADSTALSFEVVNLPSEEKHFDQAVDMRKVIGFYSR